MSAFDQTSVSPGLIVISAGANPKFRIAIVCTTGRCSAQDASTPSAHAAIPAHALLAFALTYFLSEACTVFA